MGATDRENDAGLEHARARMEALASRLDSLTFEHLNLAPALRIPASRREPLRAAAELAAAASGRDELLQDAVEGVRHATLTRFSDRWRVRPYLGTSYPVARAEDQAAAVLALEDLAAATIVADLLDPELAHALGDPGERLLAAMGADPVEAYPGHGVSGGQATGSHSGRRMPRRTGGRRGGHRRADDGRAHQDDVRVHGAPTDADWAAADEGSIASGGRVAGSPGMYGAARRLMPRLVSLGAGVTIGSWGLASALQGGDGEPLAGILGLVLAVVVGVVVARSNLRI